MPKQRGCHEEVGDSTEERIEGAEGPEFMEPAKFERRHIDKIKMQLAVMGHKLGNPLDKDVYYGEKIVARAGQPITRVMVERLREMEPDKLHFTTGGMRRLNMD